MPSNAKSVVLLAEDDDSTRSRLCAWLEQDGYQVLPVEMSGALKAANAHSPDLVLLAAEPDGLTLCRHLRAIHVQMPILMLTPDDMIERAFDAGADDTIQRPVQITTLRRRVRHLLNAAAYTGLNGHDLDTHGQPETESLAALNAMADALHRSLDLTTVVEQALDYITSYIHVPMASILLVEGHRARLIAQRGYSQETLAIGDSLTLDNSLTGVAVREKQIVQSDDLAGDVRVNPAMKQELVAQGMKSAVVVPLICQEEVLGVLNLIFDRAAPMNDEVRETLLALGSTVALAMANARYMAAEREQRLMAEALRDTAAAINSTLNLDEVFNLILAQVARVVPNDAAAIMVVEAGVGRFVQAHGYEKYDQAKWILTIRLPVESTWDLQYMLENGKAVVIPDTYNDPNWVVFPETAWIRSYVGAPIRSTGETIGFLNMTRTTRNSFTQKDADRLQVFADQAAIAINNARLYDAARRHADELQAKTESLATLNRIAESLNRSLDIESVLESALASILAYTSAPGAAIFGLDAAQQIFTLLAEHGLDDKLKQASARLPTEGSLTGLAVQKRDIILIQDINADDRAEPRAKAAFTAQGFNTMMYVPLLLRDRAMGVMSFAFNEPHILTSHEQETLLAIGSTIALALANAQHLAQIEAEINERQQAEIAQRNQRLLAEALRDTAAAINSTFDLDEVLDHILHFVTRTLPFDLANISLIEDGLVYVVRHLGYKEHGLGEDMVSVRWPVDSTATYRKMVETGRPDVVADTLSQPDWIRVPETAWIRAYVGAPIRVEGQVIGFLSLDSNTPNAFTQADGDKLRAFADQAAIAIRNARLYDGARRHANELQAKTESLATTNEIASTLYRSLDFATVVDRSLDAIMAYTHAPTAILYTVDSPTGLLTLLASRNLSEQALASGIRTGREGSLAGLAVTQKQIIMSDDLTDDKHLDASFRRQIVSEGFRSLLALPLIFQEQVVGVMGLVFREHYSASIQEQETLLSIGSTVALALVNARHVAQFEAEINERQRAEVAERDHRLLAEALRDTAVVINTTLNLDEVLERILSNISRIVPHDRANVSLIEAGVARVYRHKGYIESGLTEVIAKDWPISESRTYQLMIETGQPRLVHDTYTDPGWNHVPLQDNVRAYLGAPIRIGGQVMGFLNLDSEKPHAFAHKDAEKLMAFADQVAIAIQNARLYDTIRRHADELETRVAERTEELESERAQLRAILDGMQEGVMGALRYEGRIPRQRYVNRAMREMLGYDAEEWNPLLFKSESQTIEEFARQFEQVERTVFSRGLWKGEMKLRRKDGTEFDSEVTISRVDWQDDVLGSVMLLRDISEEKALQEQKDRFVAHASHELRTPIANLKTRLYLMQKQPDRLNEHLMIAEQVTERMKRLVEDLLDLSRFRSGVIPLERQDMVVQDLITHVLELQRQEGEQKQINIQSELPQTPIHISADPERMAQVVTNLVTNAINYTAEGGQAWVTVTSEADGYVAIEIRDSGIGISAEHLPYIFQPFYRVRQKGVGTGLGLSITKEIVERHGGTIMVESESGRGSTFTVRLKPAPVGTSA
jgi:PAS domain S-box-containing protein